MWKTRFIPTTDIFLEVVFGRWLARSGFSVVTLHELQWRRKNTKLSLVNHHVTQIYAVECHYVPLYLGIPLCSLETCWFLGHKFARDVAVAGLPAMNRSRIFNWPVRRVIHRYWKLAYEESLDQKRFVELLQLPKRFARSFLDGWGMEHGLI